MTKKSKYIFLFLRIAVVAGGIIWAINWLCGDERWSNLAEVFCRLNIGVFIGVLGVFIISQIIVGLRWWLLLRTQSIFIDFWMAVRLHFLGFFYNNFMPGSGGDWVRAWYITQHTDKKFVAVLSVFVDRVIGLMSMLIIAVFFSSIFLRGKIDISFSGRGDSFIKSIAEHRRIILGLIAAGCVVFGGMSLHRPTRAILRRVRISVWEHSTKIIKKSTDSAIIYCNKPMTIFMALGLTVFQQIIIITSFWVLGVNMGIEAGVKYYCVIFPLTWVLGALPVSIGGMVVVEWMLAYMFIKFAGVGTEVALALALCHRIVWMIISLPGAVIHLMGMHLPKDFTIEPMN
jgi:uncharacterized protein (TIRG00374 family)